ncbi:glycosyltransferase family 39 protein [Dysgonomonas sp. 520]|uniref:ArnT family glycosyltransferase n=1 Tax=Dysgonomonas sp. 520 TaxID=2302931 RepID=UPI0013D6A541|nr:glycosyltransferase family 39 protein [Dysgonomonas sp. 520]NDW10269.1 hypothetical protein [Dysgonomonas sp. 520]
MDVTIKNKSLKQIIGQEKWFFLALFIYSFLLLFLCTKLSPLYDFNYWSDVNIYFTVGKGMMNGLVPYRDLFDHKGPLIFLVYGLGYLISNDTFTGVYIIESLFFFMGSSAVYLLARLYLSKPYAFFIATLFAVMALYFAGLGGSAEEYILMLQAVGLFLFLRYFSSGNPKEHSIGAMFVQGVLIGLVFFMKLNLTVFWFFLIVAIFINLLKNKLYRNFLQNSLALLAGLFLVFAIVLAYFLSNSAISDLWTGYIEFNSRYANELQLNPALFVGIAARFTHLLVSYPFSFGAGVAGLLAFVFIPGFVRNIYAKTALVLSFVSLSFVIFLGAAMMEYYYTSFSVFLIFTFVVLFFVVERYFRTKSISYLAFIASIAGLALGCWQKSFFGEANEYLLRRSVPPTLENKFGAIIKKEKNPTLLCLGMDRSLGLFTKADIVPNVKYFFYPNIYYEKFPDIRDSQQQYIDEGKITFVVMRDVFIYYQYFKQLDSFSANYQPVDSLYEDESMYYLYKKVD